jgi:hypothetical protein
MSNPWDEVEEFVRGQKERAAASKRDDDARDALAQLNNKVDSLAESLSTFINRPPSEAPPADGGTGAPADGSSAGSAVPPSPGAESGDGGNTNEDELPLEIVRPLDVPRIYTGDDEPTDVQYIDPDSGETKTRKGRRKGHVATYNVEPYEPPAPGEEVA